MVEGMCSTAVAEVVVAPPSSSHRFDPLHAPISRRLQLLHGLLDMSQTGAVAHNLIKQLFQ
jgi:hypothetical protein